MEFGDILLVIVFLILIIAIGVFIRYPNLPMMVYLRYKSTQPHCHEQFEYDPNSKTCIADCLDGTGTKYGIDYQEIEHVINNGCCNATDYDFSKDEETDKYGNPLILFTCTKKESTQPHCHEQFKYDPNSKTCIANCLDGTAIRYGIGYQEGTIEHVINNGCCNATDYDFSEDEETDKYGNLSINFTCTKKESS